MRHNSSISPDDTRISETTLFIHLTNVKRHTMKLAIFLLMWAFVEIAFKVYKQNFNQISDAFNGSILDERDFLKN